MIPDDRTALINNHTRHAMARRNRVLIRSQRQCNRARQMIDRRLIDQRILIEIETTQETLSEEIPILGILTTRWLIREMTSETTRDLQMILAMPPETTRETLHETIRETILEMLQEVTHEMLLEMEQKIRDDPIPEPTREGLKEALTETTPLQFRLHLHQIGLATTSTILQNQLKTTRHHSIQIQTRIIRTKTRTILRPSGAINLSADRRNHRALKIQILMLRVREYQTRTLQMNAARILILQMRETQIRTATIPTIVHR